MRSKDNLLIGLNLNKYFSFNHIIWDLIIWNFAKNKFNSLQKGLYRADIPKNLFDVIRIQVNKISDIQVSKLLDEVAEKVQESTTLYPKDYEQAMNYAIDKSSSILKEHLVVPFVQKLEQPLETLSLGDENIAYLMEEELTAVLVQLIEGTISETLKHTIADEEANARDNLRNTIQAAEVKSAINSFFESFQVFDIYNEVYEMSRNKDILDKQEFFERLQYNVPKLLPFRYLVAKRWLAYKFRLEQFEDKLTSP